MIQFLRRFFSPAASTTSNPERWFIDWLSGGSKSASGMNISPKKALTYSSVYQAINLISGDVAKLPINLHESLEGGGKKRATNNPAYYLMRYKPGTELTAFYFKRQMVKDALLYGNAYAYIFRDSASRPVELRVLDSSRTHPIREDGQLLYVTQVGDEWVKLSPMNVFHLRGMGADGLTGYSFVEMAKESVGLGLAAEMFGSTFFGNGSISSGILEYPMRLDDAVIKNIRRQWNDMHQGLEKSHRVAVLDKGVQFKPTTIPPEQAQFLSTRKFQRQEIASWFNLPPHKLSDETRTSFSSLEQENASYLQSTLEPWLIAIEEEAWDKLLSEQQKRSGNFSFEFNRGALLKPDTKSRYEVYQIAAQNALMSPNEIRDLENLNPYEGGDEYLQPLNMTTVGSSDDQESTEPGPSAVEPKDSLLLESHKELLRLEVEKMVRWEADAVLRATRKENFLAAVEEFYAKHEANLAERLGPVLRCVSMVGGHPVDAAALAADYCRASFESLLDLTGALASDELASAIQEAVSGWERGKPKLVIDRVFGESDG